MKKSIKRGDVIRISHHLKGEVRRPRLKVLAIWGADIVGVDIKTGEWYATVWEPPRGTTPGQRDRARFPLTRRHWRCWPRGLYSFSHGINAALRTARRYYIPFYQELNRWCQKVDAELISVPLVTTSQANASQRTIQRLISRIKAGRSPEIREALGQLEFCVLVRDQKPENGFQLCIVRTRLRAVDRRLLERLQHMLAWQPKYAVRACLAGKAQQAADLLIEGVHNQLAAFVTRPGTVNRNSLSQSQAALRLLDEIIANVSRWQSIQPFVTWVGYTIADLNAARDQIRTGGWTRPMAIVKKVLETVKLKSLQPKLEMIIEQLEQWHAPKSNSDSHRTKQRLLAELQQLGSKVAAIDDHLWQRAVVGKIHHNCIVAYNLLAAHCYKDAVGELKRASSLM